MTDAGFFRGTNSEQDTRFSDKNKKLLRTMKFADVLSEKVDMKKVKLDTIKPWIATKITELLNLEDEVVVEYVFTQLEATVVDPKSMQINLTGFLNGKNAREFMRELWEYLLSAQSSPLGIPEKFLEAKKLELREREVEQGRVSAAIRKTKDSISQLTGSTQKEDAEPTTVKPSVTDGTVAEKRDEPHRNSPVRQQQQRRSPPFRQRYRSPQRTFRKSPSPRRSNFRRSGSRDGGRRSPYGNGRRTSPAYRRPGRRSRSRSGSRSPKRAKGSPSYRRPGRRSRSRSDSRSPKRMRGRNSPLASRRSKTPVVRMTEMAKAPVRRASATSSTSRSGSPPINRRPIPRRRSGSGSSSSSASSHGIKKKSVSPVPKKQVSPVTTPAVTALESSAPRPVSGRSDSSHPSRSSNKAVSPVNGIRPVAASNRNKSKSRSHSPVVRRDRRSPPRYRKRSVSPSPPPRRRSSSPPPPRRRSPSPPPRRRSPSPVSRRRSPSPARNRRRSPLPQTRRRTPSPPPRRRTPDKRDRSESPRSRMRKNGSPAPERKNGRPLDNSRARNDSPRRRSPDNSRKGRRDDSRDRAAVAKTRNLSTERQNTADGKKPEVASVTAVDEKSPILKLSGADSAGEEPNKKAKKAKKDKKHKKKHKKHRKEKKTSKKDISSDEGSLDIEQKLRARALECMRKEDGRSN